MTATDPDADRYSADGLASRYADAIERRRYDDAAAYAAALAAVDPARAADAVRVHRPSLEPVPHDLVAHFPPDQVIATYPPSDHIYVGPRSVRVPCMTVGGTVEVVRAPSGSSWLRVLYTGDNPRVAPVIPDDHRRLARIVVRPHQDAIYPGDITPYAPGTAVGDPDDVDGSRTVGLSYAATSALLAAAGDFGPPADDDVLYLPRTTTPAVLNELSSARLLATGNGPDGEWYALTDRGVGLRDLVLTAGPDQVVERFGMTWFRRDRADDAPPRDPAAVYAAAQLLEPWGASFDVDDSVAPRLADGGLVPVLSAPAAAAVRNARPDPEMAWEHVLYTADPVELGAAVFAELTAHRLIVTARDDETGRTRSALTDRGRDLRDRLPDPAAATAVDDIVHAEIVDDEDPQGRTVGDWLAAWKITGDAAQVIMDGFGVSVDDVVPATAVWPHDDAARASSWARPAVGSPRPGPGTVGQWITAWGWTGDPELVRQADRRFADLGLEDPAPAGLPWPADGGVTADVTDDDGYVERTDARGRIQVEDDGDGG